MNFITRKIKNFIKKSKEFELDEAELGIGGQKVKLKRNTRNMQIAYKLWVELSTRKIGLKIDLENDVIVEIYDSWYKFFRLTRELIKDMPISKIWNDKDTKEIVRIAIEVLNEGIRPHLTRWQARFRKWYDIEIKKEENFNLSPQETQLKYPKYKELTEDMMHVNQKLIKYRKNLKRLAMIQEENVTEGNMVNRAPIIYGWLILASITILIVAYGIGGLFGYESKAIGYGIIGSFVGASIFLIFDFLIIKGGSRQENQFARTVANEVEGRINSRINNLENRIIHEFEKKQENTKKK